MFKQIIGILGKARAAAAPPAHAQLRQGLQGLSKLDDALRDDALAFVCTGAPEAVLLQLQRFEGGAGALLGRPGKLGVRFAAGILSEDECVAAKAALAARNAFYRSIGKDAELELLCRLGKLFEAADQGLSLDRRCCAAPDWLLYLVNDALSTTFDSDVASASEESRPGWDVTLIDRLLAADNLPRELALQIVFERNGVDIHHPDLSLDRLLTLNPLTDYMLANGDSVERLLAQLSASGRLLLADRIGNVPALTERFAHLLVQLAVDGSKAVRDAAARHLDSIPAPHRLALLASLLAKGEAVERAHAAQLMGRTIGADTIALLDAALAQETGRPVRQAIEGALSRLRAAGDAGSFEMPATPPWQPAQDGELGEEVLDLVMGNRLELIERHHQAAQSEREHDPLGIHFGKRRERHYTQFLSVTDEHLTSAVHALNGAAERTLLDNPLVNETLVLGSRLASLPEFRITHLIRWVHGSALHKGDFWCDARFQDWLGRQDLAAMDLRMLDEVLRRTGDYEDAVAVSCLHARRSNFPAPVHLLPASCVWPYFSEHTEFIDEGLGLCPSQRDDHAVFDVGMTLDVLATFPALPARWLPRLMELATGEGRVHRAAAKKVLRAVPDIGKRVQESLVSSHQETRAAAARWLAEINYQQAVPDLYNALQKETRETVQAALLAALEELGEDIAPLLAPDTLLASARKGLKARLPGTMAWFPLDDLPACSWRDGTPVEPDIIRWWVVLACKLKEPAGNALLMRYLGLLDAASRAALASMAMRQFVAYDTRLAGKAGEYAGSAIGEKGLLALMHGASGEAIVELLQDYLREHYGRRAQVEALLEAAADSRDRRVIDFLLGMSLQFRTAYIQEKARVLVGEIALRNGWTADQLADRTVSHAQLGQDGRLELRLGERSFFVRLGANFKPVLRDDADQLIKDLPEVGEPVALKEGRHQLVVCRKALKKVVAAQTARLHQAMLAGRHWQVDEWRDYLQRHPVVGSLVQGLVWMEMAPDGRCLQLLRPASDGSLRNEDNEVVALDGASMLRLAQRALLTSKQARAWKEHFKEHGQQALFRQMMRERAVKRGAEILHA